MTRAITFPRVTKELITCPDLLSPRSLLDKGKKVIPYKYLRTGLYIKNGVSTRINSRFYRSATFKVISAFLIAKSLKIQSRIIGGSSISNSLSQSRVVNAIILLEHNKHLNN